MKKVPLYILLLMLSHGLLFSQVAVNTDNTPSDPSAILDVKSTDKGVLIPRLTQSEIEAIALPANGLMVFCSSDRKFYVYVQSANAWKEIAYGSGTIQPPCGTTLYDSRDGKSYTTILIGSQRWMAQNLNIGTLINGSLDQTNNSIIEKYCYDNLESNCDVYGGLYQWNEMMQYVTTPGVQGICPAGWHIPTDAEYTALTTLLGGESAAGGKMKETGYIHWDSPNLGATNESGFTAFPGGYREWFCLFYALGHDANFWSSTEYSSASAEKWCRNLSYASGTVTRMENVQSHGFSVRCLQD